MKYHFTGRSSDDDLLKLAGALRASVSIPTTVAQIFPHGDSGIFDVKCVLVDKRCCDEIQAALRKYARRVKDRKRREARRADSEART